MEEDIYKQLIGQLKATPPRLKDKGIVQKEVLAAINDVPERKKKLTFFFHVAASLLMLISIGAFGWLEIPVHYQRIGLVNRNDMELKVTGSQWQCRQSLNRFISDIKKTGLIQLDNSKLFLNKEGVDLVKSADPILYQQFNNFIDGLNAHHPKVYQAYLAGEDVQLSSWQLRKEYQICNWLIN